MDSDQELLQGGQKADAIYLDESVINGENVMGRELTKRHSSLFAKRVKNPLSFARDIYQYGKFRELISFAVWELCHQLGLFPKEKYLKFAASEPLTLPDESLSGRDFGQQIELGFSSRGLGLTALECDWKVLFIQDGELFGAIYPDDTGLYRSSDGGKSATLLRKFPERIKAIFVSSENTIFVCVKGAVYRSVDGGRSFEKSLDLGSSESYFRHNNAMTETPDGSLLIGEYGNVWDENHWRKLAYLYVSSDDGVSWETTDFLIQEGINKHIHLVKYSQLFDRLFMADGDNYKKLWVSERLNSAKPKAGRAIWRPVNQFHIQMGGYTSVVENDGKIVFGTDYQGGTNFLVETSDGGTYTSRVVPDPYRRSPINNMVRRQSEQGSEIWASLPHSLGNTKCLLMYSDDGGKSWNRVLEYQKGIHNVSLINSSRDSVDEVYLSIKDLRNGNSVVYRIGD